MPGYGDDTYGLDTYGIGPGTVGRATYNAWVSWSAYNIGLFSFDHSTLDGTDVLGASPLDATFGGPYDDLSSLLDRITYTRGRDDNLSTMLAGEATIDVRDPTGIFNAENPASPLYGQIEDRLHPVKLTATHGGIVSGLFYGWVDQVIWKPGNRRATAELHCVDLFYRLKRAKPIIASTGPTTTGAAIGRVLDAIGATDPGMRDLDAGDTIPDFSAGGTVDGLALIEGLLTAERGVFFVAGTGKATYRSRLSRLLKTSSATITDLMASQAPGVDFNAAQTRVTVTRTQTSYSAVATADSTALGKLGYLDDASIDGPSVETSYLTTDAQADQLAAWILSQVKTPRPPLYDFQLDNREDALLTQILARELVDRITVSAGRGGTAGDFHIDKLTGTIDTKDGSHTIEYLLSRAATLTPFVLGTSTFDGGGVLVY